jgi:hypothetical protein
MRFGIAIAALLRCTCETSMPRGQDDRFFMFDHIRMIARRNGAARPFIVLGKLGWALWRTGYDEI